MEIAELTEAIQNRAWYPVAGILVTLLVGLLRKISPELWNNLPKWGKVIPPIVISGLESFALMYAEQLPWQQALAVGLYTMIGTALVSLGLADSVNRLSMRKDKMKTLPSKLPTISLLFFTVLLLGGCQPSLYNRTPPNISAGQSLTVGGKSAKECKRLSNAEMFSRWGAIGMSFLGGASGLSSIPVEDDETQKAIQGTAAGAAVAGGGLGLLREQFEKDYEEGCE